MPFLKLTWQGGWREDLPFLCEKHAQALAHFSSVTDPVFRQVGRVVVWEPRFFRMSFYPQSPDFEVYWPFVIWLLWWIFFSPIRDTFLWYSFILPSWTGNLPLLHTLHVLSFETSEEPGETKKIILFHEWKLGSEKTQYSVSSSGPKQEGFLLLPFLHTACISKPSFKGPAVFNVARYLIHKL